MTSSINNISFNQDYSCVTVATSKDRKIFNCDPFGQFYNSEDTKDIDGTKGSIDPKFDDKGTENKAKPTSFLKMLFSTSLAVIVPWNAEGGRLLKIYNMKQKLKICELQFPSKIIEVKLNRKRLCVIVDNGQIYIYDLSCVRLMKVLQMCLSSEGGHHKAKNTFVGEIGSHDRSLLVIPMAMVSDQTDLFNSQEAIGASEAGQGKNRLIDPLVDWLAAPDHKKEITLEDFKKECQGWILVFDTIQLKPVLIYKAHSSPITKISIAGDNTKIATASSKGTIVRVFNLEPLHTSREEGALSKEYRITDITELRRGHHLAQINALSFSLDGNLLGCASVSHTIHLFSLLPLQESNEDKAPSDTEDSRSLEDLNENLANLLISKPPEQLNQNDSSYKRYITSFSRKFGPSSKLLNNSYTKSFVHKLPYKDYFQNLIWHPPRRSFAYIRFPEDYAPSRLELGFSSNADSSFPGIIYVASYQTGYFYHYKVPMPTTQTDPNEQRKECPLIARFSLC